MLVTMLHAENVFCEKTQHLYDEKVKQIQQEIEQKKAQPVAAQVQPVAAQVQQEAGAEFAKNGLKYVDIYQIHAVDSLRRSGARSDQSLARLLHLPAAGEGLNFCTGMRSIWHVSEED